MELFLSIIIPVYKIEEDYLRACFDSLIKQDMDAFQVIVVEDGSPDKSGDICDEYAARDKRFVVIHQENQGVSIARNRGIEVANTEWITFVDPDDWVELDFVSRLYELKEKYPADIYLYDYFQEFAAVSNVKFLKEESGKLSPEWVENFKIAPFNHLLVEGYVHEYETNTIWNKMYRTTLIKDNKIMFDPEARKGQDVIFNAEVLQYTNNYYYLHKPLYHYRYLQESVTNRFNEKVMWYNEIAFEHYERIIQKFNLSDTYWEAYYARVVTRLYSCMRLYYFHPDNKMSYKAVADEINKALNRYPYNTALKRVNSKQLTSAQRVFTFFLKKRQYRVLEMLVKSRINLRKLMGFKLKK